jgi:hypothetical protein
MHFVILYYLNKCAKKQSKLFLWIIVVLYKNKYNKIFGFLLKSISNLILNINKKIINKHKYLYNLDIIIHHLLSKFYKNLSIISTFH